MAPPPGAADSRGELAPWYLQILETLPAAIYATDAQGVVTFFNKAAADLAGRTPRLGIDRWCVTWRLYTSDGAPLPHDQCPMAIALKEKRAVRGAEAIAERPDGVRIPFQPYPTPLLDAAGALVGGLNMLVDISERKTNETRIDHLARHDALTDLPNRVSFEARLVQAIARAAPREGRLSLILIDLDRFKSVNDAFGHAVGDALLRAVADRLRGVAAGCFVARMGGDEFAIIVEEGAQPCASEDLAERLFAAFEPDDVVDGHPIRTGLSIGVAIYPNDGATEARLLANADAAMYRAKAEGRGAVRFFDAEMNERLRDRRELQAEILPALAKGEFLLHYQPQSRDNGEVVGFEALVRWRHPVRGLVPPGAFIPIAEEAGSIGALSTFVLREACREAARWPRPLKIAVNLSPIQFRRGDLPGLVEAVLRETGLAPERLELEVTEGVLIHNFDRAAATLRRLRALGVQISMDDFGTGYSSLSYLQKLPFSTIKIDRSFVARIGHDDSSSEIVRAIIGLGHVLKLAVIAEGVETDAQRAFLSEAGCDLQQGYLFGKPAPAAEYDAATGRPSARLAPDPRPTGEAEASAAAAALA